MKKIFTILVIAILLMTFTACEKEVQEIQDTSHITTTTFRCTSCKSNNIKVYYPPANMSHLPPSYTCNDCGAGGNLYPNKK